MRAAFLFLLVASHSFAMPKPDCGPPVTLIRGIKENSLVPIPYIGGSRVAFSQDGSAFGYFFGTKYAVARRKANGTFSLGNSQTLFKSDVIAYVLAGVRGNQLFVGSEGPRRTCLGYRFPQPIAREAMAEVAGYTGRYIEQTRWSEVDDEALYGNNLGLLELRSLFTMTPKRVFKPLDEGPAHERRLKSMALSKNYVASLAANGNITVWAKETGQVAALLSYPNASSIAIDPNGKLYIAQNGGDVLDWNIAGVKQEMVLKNEDQPDTTVPDLEISSDGSRLAVIHYNQVDVFDLPSGRRIAALDNEGVRNLVSLAPDGKRIITYIRKRNSLAVWDLP